MHAFLLTMALAAVLQAAPSGGPAVELELLVDSGLELAGAQRRLDALAELGFVRLRVRSGQPGEAPAVERRDGPGGPVYHVTARLEGDRIRLPGGVFRLTDRAGLSRWLARLRGEGPAGVTEPRAAFGLTERQLVALHERLSIPVARSTRGRPVREVGGELVRLAGLSAIADAKTRAALRGSDVVLDELQGLSAGTALAAALRPLGLVFAPEKPPEGPLRLRIAGVRSLEAFWPVGWPFEGSLLQAAPRLLKRIDVQIDNVTLAEALEAIAGRLDMPVLLDHNGLARRQIQLDQTRVSLPAGRMHYKQILDRLLAQAKMKSEVRVDEAGKAFLWISALGSAR